MKTSFLQKLVRNTFTYYALCKPPRSSFPSLSLFLLSVSLLLLSVSLLILFLLGLSSSLGSPFPKTFLTTCKKIFTRLYRVFVHVYIHHFDKLIAIGAVSCHTIFSYLSLLLLLLFQEAHINTCYKHFYYFVTEFKLVDPKEFEPLVSTPHSLTTPPHYLIAERYDFKNLSLKTVTTCKLPLLCNYYYYYYYFNLKINNHNRKYVRISKIVH